MPSLEIFKDKRVFVEGPSFFYYGKLVDFGIDSALGKPYLCLENPSVVYQTGEHERTDWLDCKPVPGPLFVYEWTIVAHWKQTPNNVIDFSFFDL
jgi:hypothetical protein